MSSGRDQGSGGPYGGQHDGSVSGHPYVVVRELDEEGLQLLRMLERKAPRAIHRRSRGFHDVPDDPGVRVGDVNNEVSVGVSGTQRVQLDGAATDVELPARADQVSGCGDLDLAPVSGRFISGAVAPGCQPGPFKLVEVDRQQLVTVDRDRQLGARTELLVAEGVIEVRVRVQQDPDARWCECSG